MRRADHLPMLDAVRFACALMVLAYHLLTVFPLADAAAPQEFAPTLQLPAGAAGFAWWGWVGVDLFFVVSGYVIAITAARCGPGQFVRRRALRLLPAAWVCASATALVLLAGSSLPAAGVATRWLTSMLLSPFGVPIDGIYWTLGVEVAFYALVAVILRGDGDNRRRLAMLAFGMALASLAFWASHAAGVVNADPAATPVRLLLLPHGGLFAVGMALHALAERRDRTIAIVTLCAGLMAGACEIGWVADGMGGARGFVATPIIPLGVFAAGVVAIALAGWTGARRKHPALAALGTMTYPLYLLNHRIAAALLVALMASGLSAGSATAAAALLVGGLAWLVAFGIEPRVRAWLAARLSPRRDPAPDTLPTASLPAG